MPVTDNTDKMAADDVTRHALPLLGCAGFGSMFSMRMCDAMLPEMGRSFQAAPAAMAGSISAFAIAYGLMQLVAGPLGDRYGKARVVSVAALCCGLTSLLTALAGSLAMLTLGRAAMGAAAAGVIPLSMAWIGDAVSWERRQAVLAQLLGYTVIGMMAGAWAGGVMSEVVGWRWAFVLVGLWLVGAAGAIARHLQGGPAATGALHYLKQVATLLRDGAARRLYVVTFIEGALVFGVLAFLPSALHQWFGVSLTMAGAELALFGVGGLAYVRLARRMLEHIPRGRMATAGGALLCVAFVVLTTMPRWWWGWPACWVAGLGFYMLHGTLQASATQLSDTARGTAVSLFACALFLGQSAGVSLMAQAFAAGVLDGAMSAAGVALLLLAAVFGARLRAAS